MTDGDPASQSEPRPAAKVATRTAITGALTGFLTALGVYWVTFLGTVAAIPGLTDNNDGGLAYTLFCCAPAMACLGAAGAAIVAPGMAAAEAKRAAAGSAPPVAPGRASAGMRAGLIVGAIFGAWQPALVCLSVLL